jgi:catechol 2,3-dioxygenase-like lactoylglutathione lyase family enzyme
MNESPHKEVKQMPDTRSYVGTVHHVSFRVTDLSVALGFYEGVLGCRRLERPDDQMPTPGAWLEAGTTQVHLIEAPADKASGYPPAELTPRANHIAFHTDDIAAAEESFRQRGIEIRTGKFLPQFFVADPDGNLLEFTTF